ncbi:MAG: hypothetical protein R3D69_12630 [Xanthobacteraceae bacterium]
MIDSHEESRRKRLGAALRENLKRRKQQLRGRAAGEGPEEAALAGEDEGEAGITGEKHDG